MRLIDSVTLFTLLSIALCSGNLLIAAQGKDISYKEVMQNAEDSSKKCPKIILSADETAILDGFIHELFKFSEGGYVLHGKKPMCIQGFSVLDSFAGHSDSHCRSVILKEGADLWKKFFSLKNDNIIVHIYNHPTSQAGDAVDILVINKKLFLEVVEKNISLFQYVLGPHVTPLALLEKLIDPDANFHKVLKYDKVLIGILLGFGVQNALHVSRIENLNLAYLSSPEQFPWKNRFLALTHYLGDYKEVLLLSSEKKIEPIDTDPSFSFSSLEEELSHALSKICCSSPKLSENRPMFIFGRLMQDEDSDRLILELEDTQDKIVELLASEKPLKTILSMIYPHSSIELQEIKSSSAFAFTSDENIQLHSVVAKNIWSEIGDKTSLFIDGFYKGMQDAHKGNQDSSIVGNNHYEIINAVLRAKENVKIADDFFAELDKDENAVTVFKGAIYYKVLQKGDGEILHSQQSVAIHCKAKTPNSRMVQDTWSTGIPIEVDLSAAIPGFSWGMKGMQENEIREIYIHPKVAYGLYTTLEKGIHLIAEVQLLSIESSNGLPFASIEPLDLDATFNRLNKYNLEEIEHNEGYHWGYSIWDHYKKEPSLSFSEIFSNIKTLAAAPSLPTKKSIKIEDESSANNLLNKLHWNIYHKNTD